MFESNKIIHITGDDESDLKKALEFCFALYDGIPNVFHITKDGALILGRIHCSETCWEKYPFTVNVDILVQIIMQHLKEQKYQYDGDYGDGSTHDGWQIYSPYVWGDDYDKTKDIHNYWFNSIIIIEPYVTFYHK